MSQIDRETHEIDYSSCPDPDSGPPSECDRFGEQCAERWTKRTPPEPKPATAKKVRASRKGIKTGPHIPIVIGERFGEFNHMQVTGLAPHDGKDPCVFISCGLCGGTGRCRFGELRRGVVKSCRCLELAADAKYYAGIKDEIRQMQTWRRKEIFEDIIKLGPIIAAKKNGHSLRFINTLKYKERDRLAKIKPDIKDAIYESAQHNPTAAVALEFEHTEGEVLHITRVVHKARQAAQEVIQATWNAMSEEARQEHIVLLRHADLQMNEAIENSKSDPWSEDNTGGRWPGELTPAEFCVNPKQYSHFGWIYPIACLLPQGIAQTLFGEHLIADFVKLVRFKLAGRTSRQQKFLSKNVKEHTSTKAKRAKRSDGFYYPGGDSLAQVAGLTVIGGSKEIHRSIYAAA